MICECSYGNCHICGFDERAQPSSGSPTIETRTVYVVPNARAGRPYFTKRAAYREIARQLWWWKRGDHWDYVKRMADDAERIQGATESIGFDAPIMPSVEELNRLRDRKDRTIERLARWLMWRDKVRSKRRWAQCCSCAEVIPEQDAKGAGWAYATGPTGEPTWQCADCLMGEYAVEQDAVRYG